MKLTATLALAALTIATTPAQAAPNPAAALSPGKAVRAAAPSRKANALSGPATLVAAVLAAAVVVGGVILVADGSDDADSN
jgi:hypothetical protein